MKKIRVFIIDDSAIVRSVLTQGLAEFEDIEVVGNAVDPFVAREKLQRTEVDVITLDLEMPRMDGLTFLRHLMRDLPTPVLVVSSLVGEGASATLEALALGAVDFVRKPSSAFSVEDVMDDIVTKIRIAANVDLNAKRPSSKAEGEGAATLKNSSSVPGIANSVPAASAAGDRAAGSILARIETTQKLVAIGASTGGTQALEYIFTRLPEDIPPILTVIHMPERFTELFARRLDSLCRPTIKEARDGELILPGTVYVAPGNFHMALANQGANRIIKIGTGPRLFNQRPAVDVLFNAVAANIGRNALGILLTGMGRDGAQGLLRMKNQGSSTIAQDEASCIVFGMPKEAIALGAAGEILSLDKIPAALLAWSKKVKTA